MSSAYAIAGAGKGLRCGENYLKADKYSKTVSSFREIGELLKPKNEEHFQYLRAMKDAPDRVFSGKLDSKYRELIPSKYEAGN
ncbi:MAG: hypothetical protein GOV00_02930 [Candidatus Altiarchaeota archaeon]|nr:hypothetical protein [Candidatus Altiarchaeota archaeon]